jgi:hypothetical protein
MESAAPDLEQLFREAEFARNLEHGADAANSSDVAISEVLEEAPLSIESDELRFIVIREAMERAGAQIPDPVLVGFEETCKDLERASHFYIEGIKNAATHACSAHTMELQELNRYDKLSVSDRWREVVDKETTARIKALEAVADRACKYVFFEKGQPFYSTITGGPYKASGDVYVCKGTCRVHHCTLETCKDSIALPHNEGCVCVITDRFYQAGFVHSNETTTRRFRDTKDGALPTQGASASADTWRPTRTPEMRRNFRHRGKVSRSRSENVINTRRAESGDSHLLYVRREDFEGTPDEGAASKIFDHSKAASPQSTITLLEFEMRKRYTQVSPPAFTTALRDQVNEYCKVMYYVAVAYVRKKYWKKVSEAEVRINTMVASYCRSREAKNLRADPFYILGKIIEETRPLMEHLIEIGFDDPDTQNRSLLLYLEEAVLAVWLLIQYTPWARRFYMGIGLISNVVGILYKLQSGVYIVSEEGERVYVIPRHPVLDKLPQKSDLNSFHHATHACVGSDDSITTEKLIDDCFMSLPKDRATLNTFCLGRYIRLWTDPVDPALPYYHAMSDGE